MQLAKTIIAPQGSGGNSSKSLRVNDRIALLLEDSKRLFERTGDNGAGERMSVTYHLNGDISLRLSRSYLAHSRTDLRRSVKTALGRRFH
jgi:hypothetical protein